MNCASPARWERCTWSRSARRGAAWHIGRVQCGPHSRANPLCCSAQLDCRSRDRPPRTGRGGRKKKARRRLENFIKKIAALRDRAARGQRLAWLLIILCQAACVCFLGLSEICGMDGVGEISRVMGCLKNQETFENGWIIQLSKLRIKVITY